MKVNQKEMDKLVSNGYKIIWLSEIDYAVLSEYPFRTMLSIMFAIKKVYPLIDSFIKVILSCFSLLQLLLNISNFSLKTKIEEKTFVCPSMHWVLWEQSNWVRISIDETRAMLCRGILWFGERRRILQERQIVKSKQQQRDPRD